MLYSAWVCPLMDPHRVLPFQLELVDGQGLGVLQLLDVLHLLGVAPELLHDKDLHTSADDNSPHESSKTSGAAI